MPLLPQIKPNRAQETAAIFPDVLWDRWGTMGFSTELDWKGQMIESDEGSPGLCPQRFIKLAQTCNSCTWEWRQEHHFRSS